MTFRKYLVLLAVVIFGSCGNVCLARGMRAFGAVTRSNWPLLGAMASPWIVAGIVLLIVFFCSYLTALSWADLTYVLPATAIGYVLTAFLAHLFLHEGVPPVTLAGHPADHDWRRIRCHRPGRTPLPEAHAVKDRAAGPRVAAPELTRSDA